MLEATVIGARGFVGSALVRRLRECGAQVAAVGRGDPFPKRAGHVYFCAGLTADFRTRLHDTIEAHTTLISELLRRVEFSSVTYLSSTRVYQRSASGDESALLTVDPRDPSDVYNLSKLAGEAICLSEQREDVRVARLSNVFGAGDPSPNFLNAVIREAKARGEVTIHTGAAGAKDYIALEDAVEAIMRMPMRARSRIINIAGGRRISNKEIGDLLERLLGATAHYGRDATNCVFPEISNGRMREELGVTPEAFESALARFVGAVHE